jgi:tetratricopeptide (TPR) repeat protein
MVGRQACGTTARCFRVIFAAHATIILLGVMVIAQAQSVHSQVRKPTPKPQTQFDGLNPAARQSLERAIAFLERQNLVEAEREGRNSVRLAPRSAITRNILGVILDQQGKTIEALTEFRTAIRLDPDFVSAKNNLGRLFATQGKLKEAQSQFEEILRLEPNHLQARYNLAALYAETGDYVRSADNFIALRKANPNDAQIAFAFLNVAYRAGRKDEANEAASFLEGMASGDIRTMFTLGVALAQGEQYERALRMFQKVNELQPSPTFEVLYNLGLVLDNLKRQDESLQFLAKAADLKPDAIEVHFRLGVIASERNDSVNAVEEFRHCVERQGDNAHFHYLLGREYFRAGFWEGAINAYAEAIRLSPKEVAYVVGRANAHYRRGEWLAAAADYDLVAEIQPDFKDIDYLRGYVHRAAGNFDKAREFLERFTSTNPENIEALSSLGYLALEQGRFADAETMLQKVLSLDPQNPIALFDFGRLAVKQRDYQSAVARLERVIAINKYNPQVFYQIFLAYSRLKQTEKANEALAEFKRLDALEKQARQERIFDERIRAQKLLER